MSPVLWRALQDERASQVASSGGVGVQAAAHTVAAVRGAAGSDKPEGFQIERRELKDVMAMDAKPLKGKSPSLRGVKEEKGQQHASADSGPDKDLSA